MTQEIIACVFILKLYTIHNVDVWDITDAPARIVNIFEKFINKKKFEVLFRLSYIQSS